MDATVDLLIVDDREENLLALEAVLNKPEYRLCRAQSGEEALAHAKGREFALILLDVQMPRMDGFETARRLRREAARKDTPIIFLTALNNDETHVHAGYDSGAVDYLFKPFDIVILRSKVAAFAEMYRKDRKIREQERLLQRAYERTETRFRAFFDQSSLAMQLFDLDGNLVLGNAAWEKLHGAPREEARGYNFREDPQLGPYQRLLDRAFAGEQVALPPFRYDPARVARQGRQRWTEFFLCPVKDDTGRIRELAVIQKDVTDEVMAMQRVEEAVRARDEFLSVASHELRTPVTSMSLTAQMLRRQAAKAGAEALTPEKSLKFVEQSERQLTRLGRLIDDMLDISRINTGRFTMNLASGELSALVRETLERLEPQIARSGSRLELKIEQGHRASFDHDRLEQALSNLVTNAIRYGEGKAITVALRQEGGFARISVEDRGMGIALADQARVFERFERAISSNEVSGLGLGLYLVRQILDAHGGSVELRSAPGRGSVFTLVLPLDKS